MSRGPNNTTELLDNESVADEVAEDPPPPYHMIAGLSSNPNQTTNDGFSGQSSVGNYQVTVSTQPQSGMYYTHMQLQPATGQLTLLADVSVLAAGEPIYLIPVTAPQANINKPSIISQCKTFQPQPTRTEPGNTMASSSNRAAEKNSKYDFRTDYRLMIFILAAVIFYFLFIYLYIFH